MGRRSTLGHAWLGLLLAACQTPAPAPASPQQTKALDVRPTAPVSSTSSALPVIPSTGDVVWFVQGPRGELLTNSRQPAVDMVSRRLPALKACHEQGRARHPEEAGWEVLELKVDGPHVRGVRVLSSAGVPGPTATCIEQALLAANAADASVAAPEPWQYAEVSVYLGLR
jgi:hypothetical protein